MLLELLMLALTGAVLGGLLVVLWALWRVTLWALDRAFEGVIK
jgi:hypothetical protein